MITIQTKLGPVNIDETMCGPAIKNHTKSIKIETKEEWRHVKTLAAGIKQWWDEKNGSFDGAWKSGYAIHHAQVDPSGVPYNFFVVDKKLTTQEWAKEIAKADRSIRDITNIIFPDQVIYNPEIITATQTFLDDTIDKKSGRRYKRGTPNVMRYDEGCMSYREETRKAKRVDRFYRIKVRYQVVRKRTLLRDKVVTIEEWVQGLKAHIFQHEIDHAIGYDIVYGLGEKKFLTIEDREREDGRTRKEVEEFTAKRLAEIEAKIQENGVCLLQSVENGRYYRCPTDLKDLPEGFLEPDAIELYDADGKIKPPFNTVPFYTDPSAKQETSVEGTHDFSAVKRIKTRHGNVKWTPNMTKTKLLQELKGYEPSKLDGCYYLPPVLFFELAGQLHHGNPNVLIDQDSVLQIYPDIEQAGFSVHGMVFYPNTKKK